MKENIEQALYHCERIDKLYNSNEVILFNPEDPNPISNILHFIWFEYENLRRQVNIMKEKCK